MRRKRTGSHFIPTFAQPILSSESPRDGINVHSTTGIVLGWKATGAQTYDVAFGALTAQEPEPPLVVEGIKETSHALPTLMAGITYAWRITAHGPKGVVVGHVSTFKVDPLPGKPTASDLTDGAETKTIPKALTWSSSNATSFKLFFGADPPPLVATEDELKTTTFALPTLEAGKTYYWQVIAYNAMGSSPLPSDKWSFKIPPAPAAPASASPDDKATDQSTTVKLTWKADGATSYQVKLYSKDDGPTKATTSTVATAAFSPTGLAAGKTYYWQVTATNVVKSVTGPLWSFSVADATDADPTALSTADTRLTVGIEQSATTSGDGSWNPVLDFMLTAPLSASSKDPDGTRHYARWLAWADIRLNGVPQTGTPTITQVSTGLQGGLVPSTSETVKGISLSAGIEIKLSDGAYFGGDKHYQLEPTLIVSAGGQTPINPNTTPPVFMTSAQTGQRYPDSLTSCPAAGSTTPAPCKYIAFQPPDRNRFERRWGAGIRLKSHHYDCVPEPKDGNCTPQKRTEVNFPGLVDITVGQDEAVTGGHFNGAVLTLSGFFPFPFESAAKSVYVFGGMYFGLSHTTTSEPLILAPVSGAAVPVPGPDVFVHTSTPDELNRDYWKFGVAVDMISLIKNTAKAAGSPTPPADTSSTDATKKTKT